LFAAQTLTKLPAALLMQLLPSEALEVDQAGSIVGVLLECYG
jgi:hypothetical protein